MRHQLVGAALVTDTFLVQLVRLFEFAARTALRTGEFEVDLRQLRPAVLHNRFIRLLDNVGAVQVRPTRFVMNDSSHRDDASIRMNTRQRRLGAVLFFRLPLFATVAGNPQTYAYGQLFNQTQSWIGNSLTNREVWGIEVEAPGVPFHRRSLRKYLHYFQTGRTQVNNQSRQSHRPRL